MYPFIRMAKEVFLTRKAAALPLDGVHVSRHKCWPWDIDLWLELNNGRTLTIFDLGRIPLAIRTGLVSTLKAQSWGLTVAGSVVRYRRRIRTFETITMRSRLLGWDARFMYIEQSMWKANGECANHAVFRTAVTDKNGIVTPDRILDAMGKQAHTPDLPDWVAQWVEAENNRPWPPMQDTFA